MNIFVVDLDPRTAAQSLIDVHVNKMIIEGCQMLANCYSLEKLKEAPLTANGTPRKYSYLHHPCSKWTKQSIENFNWLLEHTEELSNERNYRFDKTHFCNDFISWCKNNKPDLPNAGLTEFAQAMPEEYKNKNAVNAYRMYYLKAKQQNKNGKQMFSWTKRQPPIWCIS